MLIGGLNLVVGYSGQLSIGHVGLLAIGAYCFAILAGTHGVHPAIAIAASGALCALCGLLLGLPSLRLPGFYFAMATLAFALIVTEITLAQGNLTGGGVGLPVPGLPRAFRYAAGHLLADPRHRGAGYLAHLERGAPYLGTRLVAVRDSAVTAQAVGVPVFRAKLTVFVFSGFTAGVAGALFAVLQSYITPDTFVFDLGLFFFVCIIIGGRGHILGPAIGTIVLTALPEMVAPLAKLGNFFYGLLLLAVVLLVPEGIGRVFELLIERFRPRRGESHVVKPDLERLARAIQGGQSK